MCEVCLYYTLSKTCIYSADDFGVGLYDEVCGVRDAQQK